MSCLNGKIIVNVLIKYKVRLFMLIEVFKGCFLLYLEFNRLMINWERRIKI